MVTTVPEASLSKPFWAKVSKYWVFQFHVTEDGSVIVKLTEFPEPLGALPVPV
jgi:uncharacterized protein YpmS